MQLIGLARLGRDAEARTVGDNTVANLSLAFDYYDPKANNDRKRSTTWIDAALWGKQAASLEQYLLKGTQVCCTVDDLHIEEFQTRDGAIGKKLVGRITSIKLAGRSDSSQQGSAPAPAPAPAPRPQASAAPRPASGAAASRPPVDDMDDDIPF